MSFTTRNNNIPSPPLQHELNSERKPVPKAHQQRNILQRISVSNNLKMPACLSTFEAAFCTWVIKLSHRSNTKEDYSIPGTKSTSLVCVYSLQGLHGTGCWCSIKQGFFSVSYVSSHLLYLPYIKADDWLLYTSFCGEPGVHTEWMNFPSVWKADRRNILRTRPPFSERVATVPT